MENELEYEIETVGLQGLGFKVGACVLRIEDSEFRIGGLGWMLSMGGSKLLFRCLGFQDGFCGYEPYT